MNYDEIFVESVLMDDSKLKIGINPYAGGRWPSKELQDKELIALIYKLLNNYSDEDISICLFGADKDRVRNERICKEICNKNVHVIETDSSIKILALSISKMDFMISSDSLAMHLAISQRVPTVAFFAPTSAAEIDDFGFVSKVVSMSDDYCSYKPNADNSSITADRISECAHPRIEKILQEKRKANLM
ncbi:hypothetical protein BS642_09630 [Chromobacterium violaceum]|nr:hypothetical protein BS642_09630 [Chromobacterium violaceum]